MGKCDGCQTENVHLTRIESGQYLCPPCCAVMGITPAVMQPARLKTPWEAASGHYACGSALIVAGVFLLIGSGVAAFDARSAAPPICGAIAGAALFVGGVGAHVMGLLTEIRIHLRHLSGL